MRNILSMNDFLLLESKEGRTKRMLKSKGYDPQEIINSVKHDFSQLEHSSRPAYKFLYGVCRMFTDNEFINVEDIATMNNILKTISIEPHLSEYNDNLNDLSKDEIFRRFLPLINKENKDTLNKLKHMKFNEPSDYEIVKIDNFQQASKFAKYTNWCVTQQARHFDSYSSDGFNQFYFCLKKGFEKVQRNNIDAPLNEYGLSMISVCVDYNGMPLYITTRYNHDFDGENNENLCTPEQLVDEINRIIDFVADTLAIFNMKFEVELSTRPESFIGEIENWDKAEAGLKEAMDRRGMKYDINEGDGAFYGPKIDFKVKDAIGRTWQCATIQLDFNLPERFNIKYQDKDGSMKTPVMLHRVIFGSMERFHGILIEHYAGAFPTWLAPTQVTIVPISTEKHGDYAQQIYNKMRDAGIRVQLDDRSESMNYKIRESLKEHKVPYVCVVGDKEQESNAVAVRKRAVGQVGTFNVDEFIEKILTEIKERVSD